MIVEPVTEPTFHPLFERQARRVRARLALRHMLAGTAIGLMVALVPASMAWRMRWPDVRLAAPALAVLGLAAGLWFARRKRWTDTEVALFLDARLETEEAIATAVGFDPGAAAADPARAVVIHTAANALASLRSDKGERADPMLWKPVHALGLLATLGLVLVMHQPLPKAPAPASAPGSTKVQIAQVEGLERASKLGQLSARDEAQRKRLDQIAKNAEALKGELRQGMEKRDAQDKIARLREELTEERLSLGEGEERAGMESAVSKLQEADATKRAAEALGDHDLLTLDREMEKLANEREKQDRELAKKKLEEAGGAAKENGAPLVGKALADAKAQMERRAARAEALRELADAMKDAGEASDEMRTQSESLDRQGTDKAAKALAESMGKALEKLTPEERKKLAEKLQAMAKQSGVAQPDANRMKDMARDLSSGDRQKALEEELKRLANEDTSTGESEQQRTLDDAARGAEGTERQLGDPNSSGQAQSGQGQAGEGSAGQSGQGQSGRGEGAGSQGAGAIPIPQQEGSGGGRGSAQAGGDGRGRGGGPDQGTGSHRGASGPVDAKSITSRAHGSLQKGPAMPGTVNTFVPGRAGGTANARGTGDLRVVGPSEIDGVERSEVPEEYREHVRQYFQP